MNRRTISGRATGHEGFTSLACRRSVSVLGASYKFCRASYVSTAVLWNSLRSEQRARAELLPLLSISWLATPVRNFLSSAVMPQKPDSGSPSCFVISSMWHLSDALQLELFGFSSLGVVFDEDDGDEDLMGSDEVRDSLVFPRYRARQKNPAGRVGSEH